jgi:hypothetical protein
VNFNVEIIECDPVLQVSVQTVGLLRQDCSARAMMPFQVCQHLIEVGSSAHLGCFDVFEFPRYYKALA